MTFMGPTKFVFISFITLSALRIGMLIFHLPLDGGGLAYPSSSLIPNVRLPALLTRTSMRPHMARASLMHCFISPIGDVTSRVRVLSLELSILESCRSSSKDFKDRAVAIA